jgi:hypothetical protein
MRERSEALGGHLEILSGLGTGTTLSFDIRFANHPHSTVAESVHTLAPHEYAGTDARTQT